MKLWLVDMIQAVDGLCTAYVFLYVFCAFFCMAQGKHWWWKWSCRETLLCIALAGVVFIPSEAALKAMLGI